METQHQVHTNFHINKHTPTTTHFCRTQTHFPFQQNAFHCTDITPSPFQSISVLLHFIQFLQLQGQPHTHSQPVEANFNRGHSCRRTMAGERGGGGGRSSISVTCSNSVMDSRRQSHSQDNRVDTYIYVPYTGGHHIQRQHHSRPLHSRGTHTNTQSQTHTHLDYTLHFPQPQGQKNHIGCQPLPYIESLTSTEPQFLWFLAITQDKAASLTFISAFVPNSHFGSLFWHHFRTFILSLAIATSLRQLTYKYTYFFWIVCHILIPHLC